ncbi:acid phosphatase type 7 isoform X2 [Homalodisca vitripennis]|nr:acid phosphatase type 7 isoform X2 [Homalodisca vitripennis]XP_046665737.1 acid phosphatase type 7 isoform X2 [Homalodisca vitripennis]
MMSSLCWCLGYVLFLTGLAAIDTSNNLTDSEVSSVKNVYYFQPEQVHLSMGENESSIVVTWSTFNYTDSVVEYGINGLVLRATGNTTTFVDGGTLKRVQYIHRVTLNKLLPKTHYIYHCGSDLGWSPVFYFNSLPVGTDWSPRLAVYGDLGNDNAQSLPRLQEETVKNRYDMFLHVGDFAYDMYQENGEIGNEFMRQIEPIAAYAPYMVAVGNHEERYNFSHYSERFSMPRTKDNMFYSFNLGPAHFIGFSTEAYYFLNYGIKQVVLQYQWLEDDLKEATKPENRAKRPWIITFGHRPMYCSDDDKDDCLNDESLIRSGLPIVKWFGLEDLFYKYGVDLEIWAHEHSYERLWPVYNHKVYNGSWDEPYRNPGAPVHIITGSAGCEEKTDPFIPHPRDWSAFRTSDYGYARMQIFNSSHLYLEQVSDNLGGAVLDHIWLIKDHHGKYELDVDI